MMAAAQCLVPKSVATNIKSDEQIAVFTHFYGHSINLAASDSMKTCPTSRLECVEYNYTS